MRNESTVKKFLAVALTALALVGCTQKDDSAPIASRAIGPRGALGSVYGVNASGLTGRVYADPNYQTQFQDNVNGFLSTDVNPSYVGYVSANGQNNTGVFFGGRVSLTSGSIRTYNGSYADINPSSSFSIQVRDYAPQFPNAAPLPAFSFTRAQGMISSNQAQVSFGDAYGTLTLTGVINQNTFDGQFSYSNNVKYDGSTPGAAGTMGDFSVPICSFFACN